MTTLKITLAAIAVAASSTLAFADATTTGATATYQSAATTTSQKVPLSDAEKYIINNFR